MSRMSAMSLTSFSSSTSSLPVTSSPRSTQMRNKYRLYLALYQPDPLYIPPPPGVRFDTVLLLVPKCPDVLREETIRFEISEAYDGTSDSESDGMSSEIGFQRKGKGKGRAKQHQWELAVSKVRNREGLLNAAAFLGKISARSAVESIISVLKDIDLSRCEREWVRCQWYWLAIEALRDHELIPAFETNSARRLWEVLYTFTCGRKFVPSMPLPCLDNSGTQMISCEIGAYPKHHVVVERRPLLTCAVFQKAYSDADGSEKTEDECDSQERYEEGQSEYSL